MKLRPIKHEFFIQVPIDSPCLSISFIESIIQSIIESITQSIIEFMVQYTVTDISRKYPYIHGLLS